MRRECPACLQEFRHDPVTATGEIDGDRAHVIACSWVCLVDEIAAQDLTEASS